jgi:hypothetical protein
MSPQHQGKFIAYFRVSTDKQGKSGLGRGAGLQGKSGPNWDIGLTWLAQVKTRLVREEEEEVQGR